MSMQVCSNPAREKAIKLQAMCVISPQQQDDKRSSSAEGAEGDDPWSLGLI